MGSHPCPAGLHSLEVLLSQAAHHFPVLLHSFSGDKNYSPALLQLDILKCSREGLNLLPRLGASREREDPWIFLPLEWGWFQFTQRARNSWENDSMFKLLGWLAKCLLLILGWLFLCNREVFLVKTGLKYSIGNCIESNCSKKPACNEYARGCADIFNLGCFCLSMLSEDSFYMEYIFIMYLK